MACPIASSCRSSSCSGAPATSSAPSRSRSPTRCRCSPRASSSPRWSPSRWRSATGAGAARRSAASPSSGCCCRSCSSAGSTAASRSASRRRSRALVMLGLAPLVTTGDGGARAARSAATRACGPGLAVGVVGVAISLAPELGSARVGAGVALTSLGMFGLAVGTVLQKRWAGVADPRVVGRRAVGDRRDGRWPRSVALTGGRFDVSTQLVLSLGWLSWGLGIGALLASSTSCAAHAASAVTALLLLVPPVTAIASCAGARRAAAPGEPARDARGGRRRGDRPPPRAPCVAARRAGNVHPVSPRRSLVGGSRKSRRIGSVSVRLLDSHYHRGGGGAAERHRGSERVPCERRDVRSAAVHGDRPPLAIANDGVGPTSDGCETPVAGVNGAVAIVEPRDVPAAAQGRQRPGRRRRRRDHRGQRPPRGTRRRSAAGAPASRCPSSA